MAIQLSSNQGAYVFKAENNLMQNNPGNAPMFLQSPLDVLKVIGELVSTGKNLIEAAKSAVKFGKVCALFKIITHDPKISQIIKSGEILFTTPRWVTDPNNDYCMNLVKCGKIVQTKKFSCHV